MNSNNMKELASANVLAGTINAFEESECTQGDLPLTQEKQAEFDNCIELIGEHKKKVPQVAKAIAIIDREGYYAHYPTGNYENSKDFFQEVFGFERTYIFRMLKYGRWLLESNIPEGQELSETSVREMLQNGFTDEDRKEIYRKAQEICFNRQGKNSNSNTESSCKEGESNVERDPIPADEQGGDSGEDQEKTDSSEKIRQIVPEAKDIRNAIKDFRNASGRIYFPLLENRSYPKDTSFSVILKENADKFTSTGIVLGCFKLYKAATKMTVVDEETEQSIRELIRKLIKETEAEMNNLLQNPSAVTENNEN